MKVLGIDTASNVASVAIVQGNQVLAERRSDIGGASKAGPAGSVTRGGHRADLLVLVDAVCNAAGVTARDLDGVAIGAGPGSFTGLRIGMATAKGIAFAAHKPLWAVSSLAALALPDLVADPSSIIVGVLDARRGEVYAGAYAIGGGGTALVGEERVMPPGELVTFAPAGARFVGDAAGTYPELAQLPGTWGQTPMGSAVAFVAQSGARVDVLVHGAPTYIRPSEAEVKYPDGVPGALRKR